jgi:protein pelota
MRILKQDLREGEVKLVPESLEDLWHIERVLSEGDAVAGKSWRRFKASESDAGEKKAINVQVAAEKIEFAKFANRLRVTGKIMAGTPEEYVQVGSYHTFDIEPDYPVSIFKKQWQKYQLDRLKKAVAETKKPKIAIVVLDDEKAIFASLKGYGIDFDLELESSARKRDEKYEEKERQYFGEILKKLQGMKVGKIIVAGPGFTKDNLAKFIAQKDKPLLSRIIFESCSYAERSGVNELLKKGVVSKVAEEERVEQELVLMDKFKAEIGKDSGLVAYGTKEVQKAIEFSSVSDLFVLDELLRKSKEIEGMLADAERKGAKITVFSHESDGGRELAGFSGIAALLKFRIS